MKEGKKTFRRNWASKKASKTENEGEAKEEGDGKGSKEPRRSLHRRGARRAESRSVWGSAVWSAAVWSCYPLVGERRNKVKEGKT